MKRLRIISYGLLFLSASFFYACVPNFAGDTEIEEIKRIPSADSRVDAVLVTADAGATTSTAYHVFIVKHGDKIEKDHLDYAVFTCDNFSQFSMSWAENKKLLISYAQARIFKYTNFWESEDVDNWKYVVEVDLNCTSHYQLPDHDR